jgi:hypothetical protein
MNLLEKCSKNFSLWSMKVMYRWMTDKNKLAARRYARERILELKATEVEEDLKIAEMWIEFYNWTLLYTYKD